MEQFEKWWETYLLKGLWDKTMQQVARDLFEDYHRSGWKAALELVLNKVEQSNSDGSIIQYIKDELKEN